MRNALAKIRYRARTGDADGVLHSIRVAPSGRVLPPGAAPPFKGNSPPLTRFAQKQQTHLFGLYPDLSNKLAPLLIIGPHAGCKLLRRSTEWEKSARHQLLRHFRIS